MNFVVAALIVARFQTIYQLARYSEATIIQDIQESDFIEALVSYSFKK